MGGSLAIAIGMALFYGSKVGFRILWRKATFSGFGVEATSSRLVTVTPVWLGMPFDRGLTSTAGRAGGM